MNFTRRELREGRDRLKSWMPRLRAKIDLSDTSESMEPITMIAKAITDRLTEKNFDAVIIRESRGGWRASVLLKGLPAGIGTVLGTPKEEPLASRMEAEKVAVVILRGLLRIALKNARALHDRPKDDVRPFALHRVTFLIPGKIVDKVARFLDDCGGGYVGIADDHRDELSRNLVRIFGSDCFDGEIWEAASEEDKRKVLANMTTLLIHGESRYPLRPEQAPLVETPDPDKDGPRLN